MGGRRGRGCGLYAARELSRVENDREEKGDERLADGVSLYEERGCQLLPLRTTTVWNPRDFRLGKMAEVELSAENNSYACRFSHNLGTLDSRSTCLTSFAMGKA